MDVFNTGELTGMLTMALAGNRLPMYNTTINQQS